MGHTPIDEDEARIENVTSLPLCNITNKRKLGSMRIEDEAGIDPLISASDISRQR